MLGFRTQNGASGHSRTLPSTPLLPLLERPAPSGAVRLARAMSYRTKLINKNAAEHLQPGEEIEQIAIVRIGSGGKNYAVAATPGHVYVFVLGGAGFAKVKEVLTRIPIGKAVVERHRGSILSVGRRGQEQPDHFFNTLPGGGPKRLVTYVADHGGGG
jgi:hypothetical protein